MTTHSFLMTTSNWETRFKVGEREKPPGRFLMFSSCTQKLNSPISKTIWLQPTVPGAPHFQGYQKRHGHSVKSALQIAPGAQTSTYEEVLRAELTEIDA